MVNFANSIYWLTDFFSCPSRPPSLRPTAPSTNSAPNCTNTTLVELQSSNKSTGFEKSNSDDRSPLLRFPVSGADASCPETFNRLAHWLISRSHEVQVGSASCCGVYFCVPRACAPPRGYAGVGKSIFAPPMDFLSACSVLTLDASLLVGIGVSGLCSETYCQWDVSDLSGRVNLLLVKAPW